MKWWQHLLALLFVLFMGIAPILVSGIGGAIADANGCRLAEGGVYPCVIGGYDFGGLVATLTGMAWAALVSVPLAALAIVVYPIALLVTYVTKRRRKVSPPKRLESKN